MIPEGQTVTLNFKFAHNLQITKENLSTGWPDGLNISITVLLHYTSTVLIAEHFSDPLGVHKAREYVDHLDPCSFDLLSEK